LKAVVVGEFGGPEQLRLAEVADPVPGPGQVRVAVRAAGVNPVDAGNRADGTWAGLSAPCILGYDIAGIVESTGPGVAGLAPGDRVMAMTHFRDGAGGYAELAVVDAGLVAPIGPAVSFTAAAAMPLAAGTAHDLLARLALSAGRSVLVLGGGGGVGLFVVQLAARGTVRARGRQRQPSEFDLLAAAGLLVYLRCDLDILFTRIADPPRPWLADQARQVLAPMLSRHYPVLAARAHLVINVSPPGRSPTSSARSSARPRPGEGAAGPRSCKLVQVDGELSTVPSAVGPQVNCYGHVGPWRERRGWEQMAQSVSGLAMNGAAVPCLLTCGAANDYITGFLAGYGAMAALRRQMDEGGSWWLRVSLCQTGCLDYPMRHDRGSGSAPHESARRRFVDVAGDALRRDDLPASGCGDERDAAGLGPSLRACRP
jgi:hypothetical protein